MVKIGNASRKLIKHAENRLEDFPPQPQHSQIHLLF
jgi:hypothetical protein